MGSSVDERAKNAGELGLYLKERLKPFDISHFHSLPFADQISFIYKPSWGGLRPPTLARASLSYLGALVPVQVHISSVELNRLINHTAPVPELPPKFGRPDIMTKRGLADSAFPFKRVPHALTKANVFFDEVGRDLWRLDRNFCYEVRPYIDWMKAAGGVTNDQATSMLLYAWSIREEVKEPCRWAASVILFPKYAKEISVFLKATGGNSTSLGSLLVEGETLQGRGVGGLDLLAEAKNRCSIDSLRKDSIVEFEKAHLAAAIQRILDLEITLDDNSPRIDFPSLEDHWNSRWVWAVNGSHSSRVDQWVRPGYTKHPDIHRYHRRAWLEEIKEDPRLRWDGTTLVSASPKLEHGKTRAIYACDTVNYLSFEHLMSGVERRWKGLRVILNPGKGGHLGMVERVARNRERSGISLMLDYDDFNSHHSIEAMQLVTELTCRHVGYPSDLEELLIKSLDNQQIYVGARHVGRAAGTLMSGHRCTTFFNSVLNMAYLMVVLGIDFLLDRNSLHVGDDVYLGVRNYQEADFVTSSVMKSRLRMNPQKQSVGHVSTEFLRVATARRDSYGYLTRCIASIVSGNWVSEVKLDPFEALTTMVASARTLANRSHSLLTPLLLRSAVRRTVSSTRLDDDKIDELLCGGLAINNGPQFSSGGIYRYLEIRPSAVKRDKFGYAPLKLNATHAYLSECTTELEREILARAGVSVESDMEKSSYSKTLRFDVGYFDELLVSGPFTSQAIGSVAAESLLRIPAPRGLLTEYPLLTLAKHRLPEYLVREALAAVGGDKNTKQLHLDAWGEYKHGCIVNTVMSYSDASSLGKRTQASVLTSTRRCFV